VDQGSSRLVAVVAVLLALVGFLSGALVGPYMNPRYVTETVTVTTTALTTVTIAKTEFLPTTTTVTKTFTITAVPTMRITVVTTSLQEQPSRLRVGESKTYTFSLPTCRYRAIEVYLERGSTIAVEWDSDRQVFVGVGTKQELDALLSNKLCLSAHMEFRLVFTHDGYGYSGRIEYRAPYTGTHYVVVFTGWNFGTYTADITLKITRTS